MPLVPTTQDHGGLFSNLQSQVNNKPYLVKCDFSHKVFVFKIHAQPIYFEENKKGTVKDFSFLAKIGLISGDHYDNYVLWVFFLWNLVILILEIKEK